MDKATKQALDEVARRVEALSGAGQGNGGGVSASMLSRALTAAEEAKAASALALRAVEALRQDNETLLSAMAELEGKLGAKTPPTPIVTMATVPAKTELVIPPKQAEAAATHLFHEMQATFDELVQRKINARIDYVLQPQILDLGSEVSRKLQELTETLDHRVGSQMHKRTQEIVRQASEGPLERVVRSAVAEMLIERLESIAGAVLMILLDEIGRYTAQLDGNDKRAITVQDLAMVSVDMTNKLAKRGVQSALAAGDKNTAKEIINRLKKQRAGDHEEFMQVIEKGTDQPVLPTDVLSSAKTETATTAGAVVASKEGFDKFMGGDVPSDHRYVAYEAAKTQEPPIDSTPPPPPPATDRKFPLGGLGEAAGFKLVLDKPKCKITARPGYNLVGRYLKPLNGKTRTNWRVWHWSERLENIRKQLPECKAIGLEVFCIKIHGDGSYKKVEIQ